MSVIAIFNANDDTVEVLRYAMESAGFETVSGHVPDLQRGRLDLIAFMEQHRPAAVVYDVPPPYDRGWAFLKLVREAVRDVPFVLTTTNKRALESVVGPNDAYEILGKPYDIEHVVEAVRKILARDTERGDPGISAR